MPFNRYDTITTSTYNPRSLQESLLVPMARRQQHDLANQQLESQMSELDKIDPLDVHFKEAQKIKSDLTKRIDEQASGLASKGFDFSTTGDILKTNRFIKDQFAPTGQVGQINAAKKAYIDTRAAFLKDAVENQKQSMSDAVRNWNAHASATNYTGYGDDAKTKIAQIGALGAPKHIDVADYVDKLAKNAGYDDISKAFGSGALVDTGQPGSARYTINSTEAHRTGSNIQRLLALKDHMNQIVSDPTHELTQSELFKGRDINKTFDQITSQIGIYGKTNQVDNYGSTISGAQYSKPEDVLTQPEVIADQAQTSKAGDLKSRVNSIHNWDTGKILSNLPSDFVDPEGKRSSSKRPEDVLNKDELTQYYGARKNLAATTKGWSKLSEEEKVSRVADRLEQHSLTFSPTIMKATGKNVAEMMPTMSNVKNMQDVGHNMLVDALSGGGEQGARVIYSAIDGKPYSKADLANKNLELVGFQMPHNLRGTPMEGATSKQKVAPLVAIMTDEKGNKTSVYVSRTKAELDTPRFQQQEKVHKIFNEVVNNMGTTRKLTTVEGKLHNYSVKYDPDDVSGKPIILTPPGGTSKRSEHISLDEWQQRTADYNNIR